MDWSSRQPAIELLNNTSELNAQLHSLGRNSRILAETPFGREIMAIQVGGEDLPAIMLTAGAHATEIEGILAALHIAETANPSHLTYIVPVRDPLGMEGYSSTLQTASHSSTSVRDYQDAIEILRNGTVIYDDNELIISAYGDVSFAIMERSPEWSPWGHHVIYQRLREVSATDQSLATQLHNRRILIPAASPDLEGLGDFDRAWTAFGSEDDVLHLNRFFDVPDAPVEVSALRDLIDEVQPGLVIDLHAGTSDRFWLPYPLPQQNDELSRAVAVAMTSAVSNAGHKTATLDELRAEGGISPSFFDSYVDFGNGVTPFYTDERGEGLNFMDYCRRFGVSVGTEAGQRASLTSREDMVYQAAIAGIRAWEEHAIN